MYYPYIRSTSPPHNIPFLITAVSPWCHTHVSAIFAVAGNNSRGGAGGGQSLADRAGVCLDPHIIIRAAASHGLGCDRVGVASSDWPQALLSANSNNSPSSASSGSSGAIGESEAVGLAGALEVLLKLL